MTRNIQLTDPNKPAWQEPNAKLFNVRISEVEEMLKVAGIDVMRQPSGIPYSPHDHLVVLLTDDDGGPNVYISDAWEMSEAALNPERPGIWVGWHASMRENETLTPCDVIAELPSSEDAVHLALRLIE